MCGFKGAALPSISYSACADSHCSCGGGVQGIAHVGVLRALVARFGGTPILGSGRVFTVPEDSMLCDVFRIPAHFTQITGIDFGMRYQAHEVTVPIAGRFMMHPDDAAFATKLLMTGKPDLKTAIPQHHRFKGSPGWMGTPEEYEAEIRKLGLKVEALSPEIGKVYTLKKRRRGAARSREIDLEGVPSATLRCVRAAGRMARSTVAWPPVAPGVLIGSACDARRASRSGSTRARSACR